TFQRRSTVARTWHSALGCADAGWPDTPRLLAWCASRDDARLRRRDAHRSLDRTCAAPAGAGGGLPRAADRHVCFGELGQRAHSAPGAVARMQRNPAGDDVQDRVDAESDSDCTARLVIALRRRGARATADVLLDGHTAAAARRGRVSSAAQR